MQLLHQKTLENTSRILHFTHSLIQNPSLPGTLGEMAFADQKGGNREDFARGRLESGAGQPAAASRRSTRIAERPLRAPAPGRPMRPRPSAVPWPARWLERGFDACETASLHYCLDGRGTLDAGNGHRISLQPHRGFFFFFFFLS